MTACLLALAMLQAGAGTPVDDGVLIVRVDTVEVARESFRLRHGRLSRGAAGWTLATTIRYDRARLAPATLNREPARLRHITLGEGQEAVHLWLDEGGRLMKVEIPSRHLTAERSTGG